MRTLGLNESMGTFEAKPVRGDVVFLKSLVDKLLEVLSIPYAQREIVAGLLKSSLKETVEAMLDSYLNGELEILAQTFRRSFKLTAEVNRDHATHAKFNDLTTQLRSAPSHAKPNGCDDPTCSICHPSVKPTPTKSEYVAVVVPCCERDTDEDGNCDVHPKGRVVISDPEKPAFLRKIMD